jgi:hypothetical protein
VVGLATGLRRRHANRFLNRAGIMPSPGAAPAACPFMNVPRQSRSRPPDDEGARGPSGLHPGRAGPRVRVPRSESKWRCRKPMVDRAPLRYAPMRRAHAQLAHFGSR